MKQSSQFGFTLIELVFVMVLMAIISVIIGKFLFQSYNTFQTANNINEVEWQGFLGLNRMVSDIHTIRSSGDISTISSNNFVFTDINGNAVQYQLSGTSLTRNGQVLASGIQTLSLSYFDENNAVTSTPSLTRFIKMSLSVAQGTISTSYSTIAAVRVTS